MEKMNRPLPAAYLGLLATAAILAAPWLPWWLLGGLALGLGLAVWRVAKGSPAQAEAGALDHLAGFVEQSLVGVYLLDADRIIYGNQAMADMLGLAREALSDLPLCQIIYPADLNLVRENVRRRLSGELRSLRYGFRFLRADGTLGYCEVHSRVTQMHGRALVVGVMIDVSERAEAQQELALYARAFEASGEAMLVTAADGRIVALNPAMQALAGQPREALLGQLALSLEADAASARLAQIIQAAERAGRWQGEYCLQSRQGLRHSTMLSISALRNAEQVVTHYVAILSDLSQAKAAERALQESERKFRAFVELSLVGIFVIQAGRLVYANPKLLEMLGYTSLDALPQRTLSALSSLDTAGEPDSLRYTFRLEHCAGHALWLEAHGRHFDYEGQPAVIGTALDVSQRVESERQGRLAERVFESASEGILITDADNRIVAVNPAFTRITGYEPADALGKHSRMLMGQGSRAAFNQDMREHLFRDGYWQGEMRDRRKNGEWYPVWMSISAVRDEGGQISNFVGVFTDYTSRKETENRLHYLANHDGLTGLLNRHGLLSSLRHEVEQARIQREQLAVLFLDLDRFKAINDTLGHGAGDRLLVAATERLRYQLKNRDLIGRLGGDEFTVVLDGIAGPEVAVEVAQRVVRAMAQPFVIDGHEMFVTASVGVALYPGDGADAQTLLKNADIAMYQAKERGRSTYQFFDKAMNAEAFEHLLLENSLRHALDRGEFELHYQPQVATQSGEIVGVEALIRWRHPELGLLSPAKFIPLAEQNGLIVAIGSWVLEEACRQGRAWLDAGLGLQHIAVNLSARQFASGDLLDTVDAALLDSQLPAAMLELEITESTIMQNPQEAAVLLQRLRERGVVLSIDDFGTGHSSLVSLKQYPLDSLKIDRGFVQGLPNDEDDQAITETIIAIARKMRLKVVAEGVETPEQLAYLRDAGCELAQGYLLGRPQPAYVLQSLLQRREPGQLPGAN